MLHEPHRVFQKDNRVVHQEPDRKRQSHQRQIVQAVAQNIHYHKREQQRERQSDGRDQCVAGAAEKSKDDQHYQCERNVERLLHVLDAIYDCLRTVINGNDSHRTGKLRPNRGKQIADRLGNVDGVRPSAPKHRDHHRCRGNLMASEPKTHPDALVLEPVFGGRDVLQVHRGSVSLPHDQVVVLTRFAELALRLKKESVVFAVKLTRPCVTRPVFQCRGQVIDCQVASRHRRRVCLDSHGRLSTVHGDLANPRQNADALTDLRVSVVI